LPTDVLSVYECVYECLKKHIVLYTVYLRRAVWVCVNGVNVACSVRSALSGQLD